MKTSRGAFALALATIVLLTPSRAALRSAGPAAVQSLISVNDEIELGKQSQEQVRKQTPALNDSTVNNYVKNVFQKLAKKTNGPKYPYSVSIANYAEVNAFSLPGGPVWVHRGAIQAAENESELAGVLAHEIAHIEKRHVAEQITKQMVAGGLLAILERALPNNRRGKVGEVAGAVVAQGVMLKFSREAEREADMEGTRIMRAAGWDPRGLADFLDVLSKKSNPSSVEIFLSDHPGSAERAAALRAEKLPAGGTRDTQDFQKIHSRLQSMPPAEKMPTK